MRVTDIQTLFEYNAWATARLLATATALTEAQFVAPTRFPGGSLCGCLLHIVAALRFHLACWQGEPLGPELVADDFPDVDTLARRWAREEAALRAFLATLTDADLDRPQSLIFADEGVRMTAPLWQLLLHNVNHATQHRSDAAQMLTDHGHSPGDLDFSEMLPTTPL